MAHRDIVSKTKRSEMMRGVAQGGTPCERTVAAMVSETGRRYRLNSRSLPGSPDISNRRRGWAIFVNGCFWHGHKNCPKTKSKRSPRIPGSNKRFWKKKLAGNRERDARKCLQLRALGVTVLIIWECQLRNADKVRDRLMRILERNDRREDSERGKI